MSDHHNCKRFSPKNMARLDNCERVDAQPTEKLISVLGLHGDMLVGDFGVGTGYFALPIAARLEQLAGTGRVVAMDVAPLMLAELRNRANQANLDSRIEIIIVPESGLLPVPENSLDRLVCVAVVHELDELDTVFARIHRIVAPGGEVFIVDWRPDGPADIGPKVAHRLPAESVEKSLAGAGFSRLERLPIYEFFYTIKAVK